MKTIIASILLVTFWVMAYFTTKVSDFSLFECFAIFCLSGLITDAVNGWFKEEV